MKTAEESNLNKKKKYPTKKPKKKTVLIGQYKEENYVQPDKNSQKKQKDKLINTLSS
jgi:hypothetical protein